MDVRDLSYCRTWWMWEICHTVEYDGCERMILVDGWGAPVASLGWSSFHSFISEWSWWVQETCGVFYVVLVELMSVRDIKSLVLFCLFCIRVDKIWWMWDTCYVFGLFVLVSLVFAPFPFLLGKIGVGRIWWMWDLSNRSIYWLCETCHACQTVLFFSDLQSFFVCPFFVRIWWVWETCQTVEYDRCERSVIL